MWVPTLKEVVPGGVLPTGLIFSSFMVCITIGGVLFSIMLRKVSKFFLSFLFLRMFECLFSVAIGVCEGQKTKSIRAVVYALVQKEDAARSRRSIPVETIPLLFDRCLHVSVLRNARFN